MEITLLTGGGDRPYAFGLAHALASTGLRLDVVAGDNVTANDFAGLPQVTVLKLRHEPPPGASFASKALGILGYYARLLRYAFAAQPAVFHILWNNKFETFDRVVLMLYYRLLGKKIVLTAHNINAGTRDSTDTWLNRATLGMQYRLADHVFVHTEKMKQELVTGFSVAADNVTVIPFGINNAVPRTAMTGHEARRRLGIGPAEKTVLFFGNIGPYKGVEYLVDAFEQLSEQHPDYRLIVAGRPKQGFEDYWERIKLRINKARDRVLLKIEFVPDEETEIYFKAADVLALPYVSIFQSGVLVLGYSFGLPVLAADVGSLKDDVVEGETGYLFPPADADAFAKAVTTYFTSDLFNARDEARGIIQEYARAKYSWQRVADEIQAVYTSLVPAARHRYRSPTTSVLKGEPVESAALRAGSTRTTARKI